MLLIAKGSLFHSFGAATEKAFSPTVEVGVCSMRSKPLLFTRCLLTILIDINSDFNDVGSS